MVKFVSDKIKGMEKEFLFFIIVGIFLGIGQSVDGSTMNNFWSEKLKLTTGQRTNLEILRELPGLLVFLVTGFLYALGDIRIAAIANVLAAIGMFALGIIPESYAIMLMCIFVYSMGQHVYMPLANSIGMSFANDANIGRKLGQVNAANTAALVVSSAVLWLLFKYLHIGFMVSFSIGATAFLLAALFLILMNPKQTVKTKNRFVFRREYKLYYWLSVLYGIRKQIFITFAPWVLVKVFSQKVTTMTILFFIISVTGIFVKPFVGYLIDKVGEKFILGFEAAALFFVCLGYAFASDIFSLNGAILMVSICYIIDQTLNAVTMARATYLRKIVVEQSDLSTTLSTGISIDHIMSMFIPTIGGIVWISNGENGYKLVFIGGAILAIINFISTRFIKVPQRV